MPELESLRNRYLSITRILNLSSIALEICYQEFEVRDGCVADLPQFIAQPVNDLYSSFERTQFALSRKWQLDSLDDILKDLKTDSLEDTLKRLDELPTVKKYGNFFFH